MHLTRDLVVTGAATIALLYEVAVGGGRPAVLTALVSILLSPVIMRVDEVRKNGKEKKEADKDD